MATMAEVLDPDGVWTEDLIALMLPVAIELEADQTEAMFGAVGAAVAGLFGKEAPKAFSKGIESVRRQVRESQRRARGLEEESGGSGAPGGVQDPAEAILGFFKSMGMRVPKQRPRSATPRKDSGKKRR